MATVERTNRGRRGNNPIPGPSPLTGEWYEARFSGIFASESAAACGLSEYRQPLDVYLEKRRLVEPFEGNDYTRRGKRAESFILNEYAEQTGCEVESGLPMFFHPTLPHIGATPDGRRRDNPRRLVEAKLCNWRRAAALGEESTDEVFPDWVCQAQQQMGVMDADACDVFVMLDAHTYRLFTIERNQVLIDAIFAAETELWNRIQSGDPPTPNYGLDGAAQSISKLFGKSSVSIDLDDEASSLWEQKREIDARIKADKAASDEIKARLLFKLGDAMRGKLPLSETEIVRTIVSDSVWSQSDIEIARSSLGSVKRKGHVRLSERKVKNG